jgi:hypothetical protein
MVEERQLTIDEVIEEPKQLSAAEQQRMAVYEAAVEAGFGSQNAQILALVQIRDERLYRAEYGTFDAYCERRWGKSARRMNELIQQAQVIKNLTEENERFSAESLPENTENGRFSAEESLPNSKQAVELARLDDPEEQREVWEEVTASEKPVTAKKVAEAVDAVQAEKVYPSLAVSGWSAKEVLKAKGFLDAMPESAAAAAASVVGQPGWPSDRALLALESLAGMEEKWRSETLRLVNSQDSRERSRGIARLVRQKPAADPRRMVLEQWLPEVERCAKMFPQDPLTDDMKALVAAARAVIAAIRRQEESNRGTEVV